MGMAVQLHKPCFHSSWGWVAQLGQEDSCFPGVTLTTWLGCTSTRWRMIPSRAPSMRSRLEWQQTQSTRVRLQQLCTGMPLSQCRPLLCGCCLAQTSARCCLRASALCPARPLPPDTHSSTHPSQRPCSTCSQRASRDAQEANNNNNKHTQTNTNKQTNKHTQTNTN